SVDSYRSGLVQRQADAVGHPHVACALEEATWNVGARAGERLAGDADDAPALRRRADFQLHFLAHLDLRREGGEPDVHHNRVGVAGLKASSGEQVRLQQLRLDRNADHTETPAACRAAAVFHPRGALPTTVVQIGATASYMSAAAGGRRRYGAGQRTFGGKPAFRL